MDKTIAPKKCKDHLGNEYDSVGKMCKAYGIRGQLYYSRIRAGWKLDEALTKEKQHGSGWKSVKCTDHLGNEYDSVNKMCKAYGVERRVYYSRIKAGWSLADALTKGKQETPLGSKQCRDHLGNSYSSVSEMCRAYNVERRRFYARINIGWTLEDALTKNKQGKSMGCKDHLGNEYSSVSEMCAAYGIDRRSYYWRIRAGWTVKDALTKEKQKPGFRCKQCVDHIGRSYESVTKMCEAYGISPYIYHNRIGYGWSKGDALTKPVKHV